MIAKVLLSGYDERLPFPSSTLLPAFSKGFDREVLRKQASIFEEDYDKFERKPGYTYIHLISVADGNHYGPNSRADFYNWEPEEVRIPFPEKGTPAVIQLGKGITGTHNDTFMRYGNAYTEHRTPYEKRYKDVKPQGYVVIAKTNDDMRRGELIIGVETDKWSDDIQRMAQGHPLKFSIGAASKRDICSICGRVAHKESDHCDHYNKFRGEIDGNGNQVYVMSDDMTYYDISRVRSPAEKIAFAMKKVASTDMVDEFFRSMTPPSVPSNVSRSLLKTATSLKRAETLRKLSAIEKEIITQADEGSLDRNVVDFFKQHDMPENSDERIKDIKIYVMRGQDDDVLGAMNQNDMVLSPEEFIKLFVPELYQNGDVTGEQMRGELRGMFGDIEQSQDYDCFCDDETYEPKAQPSKMIVAIVKRASANTMGMPSADALSAYILGNTDLTCKRSPLIVYQKSRNSLIKAASKEYASYLTSALSGKSGIFMASALIRALI